MSASFLLFLAFVISALLQVENGNEKEQLYIPHRRRNEHLPHWLNSFSSFHHEQLQLCRNGRILVYQQSLTQGVGDVMTGIVTAFLLALLSHRAFVINERFFNELYVPAVDGFDWRWNSRNAYCVDTSDTLELIDWGTGLDVARRILQTEYNRNQFRLRSNRGHVGELWDDVGFGDTLRKELGLRSKCSAFGELWHLLFRPSLRIQDALKQFARHLPDSDLSTHEHRVTICAHIRTGDQAFSNDSSYLDVDVASRDVIRCTKTLAARYGNDTSISMFVFSDNARIREHISKHLPSLVQSIPWQPSHTGYFPESLTEEEQRDRSFETHQEWLLFSKCTYLMPTTTSGFSRTAIFAALQANKFDAARVIDPMTCETMNACLTTIDKGAKI